MEQSIARYTDQIGRERMSVLTSHHVREVTIALTLLSILPIHRRVRPGNFHDLNVPSDQTHLPCIIAQTQVK